MLLQYGERLGGLSDPMQNTRHRQSGAALLDQQTSKVDALDPIEHQHIAVALEEVVTGMGEPWMRRERQQRTGLGQQAIGGPVRRHAPHLESDKPTQLVVAGEVDAAHAPLAQPADDLVTAKRADQLGVIDGERGEKGIGGRADRGGGGARTVGR